MIDLLSEGLSFCAAHCSREVDGMVSDASARKHAWFPLGEGAIRPRPLGSIHKTQIVDEIASRGYKIVDLDALFEQVAQILGAYDKIREFSKDTTPKAVRQNLKKALDAALALSVALGKLDRVSLDIISKLTSDQFATMAKEHIKILAILVAAEDRAKKFPRGRPHDFARHFLAVDVAVLHLQVFDFAPTTSKDGVYIALLAAILEAATGKPVSEVHELAREGVAAAKLLLKT